MKVKVRKCPKMDGLYTPMAVCEISPGGGGICINPCGSEVVEMTAEQVARENYIIEQGLCPFRAWVERRFGHRDAA